MLEGGKGAEVRSKERDGARRVGMREESWGRRRCEGEGIEGGKVRDRDDEGK